MIRFECDTCHRLKSGDKEEWILGFAAENIGAVSARREISFDPQWDSARALHPLAVHFCSVECKDKYLKALFGDDIAVDPATVVPLPKRVSARSTRAAKRTRRRA